MVHFEELAQGATSVQISLGTEIYVLRKTHAGKLILNK
jgi:hemin uptake protein HemP